MSIAIASSSADAAGALSPGRAQLRLVALAGWSAVWFLTWATLTVLTLPWVAARRAVRRGVFRRWAHGVARLVGLSIRVEGTAPSAPFFLVSNHLSYLDIITFAAVIPARFVAKREVRDWPVIGVLAATMATIFVDRTQKRDAIRVLDAIARAVSEGDGVVLFAEATSSAGEVVLPFRSALLEWPARTGQPVYHASVSYRTPAASAPAHLSVCWWGDMTFGSHLVDLCRLPSIEATLRFGETPIAADDRKQLAELLHQAVSARFTPVVLEPE
jgi:1-acyl-sn-glycerol-3-phosphate acyltransferase